MSFLSSRLLQHGEGYIQIKLTGWMSTMPKIKTYRKLFIEKFQTDQVPLLAAH